MRKALFHANNGIKPELDMLSKFISHVPCSYKNAFICRVFAHISNRFSVCTRGYYFSYHINSSYFDNASQDNNNPHHYGTGYNPRWQAHNHRDNNS